MTSNSEPKNSNRVSCPLDVIIVGAGLGGLATAYLLGRAGHKVTILEGSSKPREIGAGLQISPNITKLFDRWGVGNKLREVGITPTGFTLRRYKDGEVLNQRELREEKEYGASSCAVHRADAQRILVDLAAPYAALRLNSRVVDIDPSTPSATLSSGEVVKADLLIGADGIHSRVRDTVVGHKEDATPTGDAAYRATIPAELIQADPDLKFLVEGYISNVWIGPGRRIVGYLVRKDTYNIAMIHPARDANEDFKEASLEDMKAQFTGWEPRVMKLLDLVPSTILWSLLDRSPLESWVHSDGKVCLLGDACHPMLPYRAQGAAMALEDAAVIGNLLSRITSLSELPALLRAYQTIRHGRASSTQYSSRENREIFHLPDGPAQEARDAAMRATMEAALKEAKGESFEDCKGAATLRAERDASMVQYGYDADEEVEKWWKENRGKDYMPKA
ncbi:hypothetical protein BKA70DRAFT_1528082 [Coprinopsis sp. MPI-PUGE-AT-0042]|nr:hypothetical protein BKA70DRAFT_1528082 [Coprinopsis sp. MPI-PUGE-AT-0042]